MPDREPTRAMVSKEDAGPVNLAGFTLSAGSGRCEIGFTGDYTPSETLVETIQHTIDEVDSFDVTLHADRKRGILILIVGAATQAMNILINFILRMVRESGYEVAAA